MAGSSWALAPAGLAPCFADTCPALRPRGWPLPPLPHFLSLSVFLAVFSAPFSSDSGQVTSSVQSPPALMFTFEERRDRVGGAVAKEWERETIGQDSVESSLVS